MTTEEAIQCLWVHASSDLREGEFHDAEIVECKFGDTFVRSHFYNGCEFTAPVNLIDCVVEHRAPIPIANGAVNSVFIWLGDEDQC